MTEQEAREYETLVQVLCLLSEVQQKCGRPVEVSIGWVKDGVLRPEIVIKSAQSLVTRRLIEAGFSLEILPQGVRVY